MEKVREFLDKIRSGFIAPQASSLEYMGWLQDPDLESLGMNYMHGDCHLWTQALHDFMPEAEIGVIASDQTGILHSYLIIPNTDLALDAGGLRPIETVLQEWDDICDGKLVENTVGRLALDLWYSTDEAGLDEVKEDLAFWVDLTAHHWLVPEACSLTF